MLIPGSTDNSDAESVNHTSQKEVPSMKLPTTLPFLLTALLLSAVTVKAQEFQTSRDAELKALDNLAAVAVSSGSTTDHRQAIEQAVKTRLERAGIRVAKLTVEAQLTVSIILSDEAQQGLRGALVRAEVRGLGSFRNGLTTPASMWARERVLLVHSQWDCAPMLVELVDEFIADYLTVNPRGK